MTITEYKLKGLNNEPPKMNKKPTPKSINENLTSCYFSALFLGAKNSGKTTGLCKLIHNYEQYPIKVPALGVDATHCRNALALNAQSDTDPSITLSKVQPTDF